MRFRLVPLEGGSSIELTRDLTLVGRKEDCDLRLDHKSISKFHCVIVKAESTLLLRDLGSTNGTFVNGKKIRRATLRPNDCLTIASIPFRIKTTSENDKRDEAEGTIQIPGPYDDDDVDKESDSFKTGGDEIVHNNDLPDSYPTGD